MGLLNQCYQVAEVAIVAGSLFTVGGHNIFEPILLNVPVLFGPHMHSQLDLEEIVLHSRAGKRVTLEQLPHTLLSLLTDQQEYASFKQACQQMAQEMRGSSLRTYEALLKGCCKVFATG